MEKYLFKTDTTMKRHNEKNWWINSDCVSNIEVEAGSINEALEKYAEIVDEKYCIGISKNALKTRRPMYIDTKDGRTIQTGYVITGSTEFQKNGGGYSTQFIDLWVEILRYEYAVA